MCGEKRGARRKRRDLQIMQCVVQRSKTIIMIFVAMGMIIMGVVVVMRFSETNILRILVRIKIIQNNRMDELGKQHRERSQYDRRFYKDSNLSFPNNQYTEFYNSPELFRMFLRRQI